MSDSRDEAAGERQVELERALAEKEREVQELAVRLAVAKEAEHGFMATVSHELRTPLNGVIGMTGLLLDTKLTEEQRDYVDTIRQSSRRLLSILNDILDFSRLSAGQIQMEFFELDMQELVEDACIACALSAHEKNLDIAFLVDDALPHRLRGDPARLSQVLLNLLANAVKFTDSGHVLVRAIIADENDSELMVKLSVEDTGIGITNEKLERLFQPFVQGDSSLTRRHGGTGLGLAVSERLVQLMGGEMGAVARDGGGSVFWFTARLEKSARIWVEEERCNFEGKKVLVVDDSDVSRESLRAGLVRAGCLVEEAQSVQRAEVIIREASSTDDPVNIVFVDVDLPGFDVAKISQSLSPSGGEHVLVALLPLAKPGFQRDILRGTDFADDLTKPIKHSQLLKCLDRLLAERPTRQLTPIEVERITEAEETSQTIKAPRVRRILVVEDNVTSQRSTLEILERLGYYCEAVANGKEALEVLQIAPYDLVLMDVRMPVLDGLEATRAVRSGRSRVINRMIPIVGLSTHVLRGDRERCLRAGMNDVVTKPVTPVELDAVIASQFRKAMSFTPMMPMPPAVFDSERLMVRATGDVNAAFEVATRFLSAVPDLLAKTKEALDQSSTVLVADRARAIKTASVNVGALLIADTAHQIEQYARADKLTEARAVWESFDSELDRFRRSVQEWAKRA